MKRFKIFSLLLVVVGHGAYSMDLVRKPYNPTDEQCMRVALYLKLPRKINQEEQARRTEFLSRDYSAVQKVNSYLLTIDKDAGNAVDFLNSIPTIKVCDLISRTENLEEKVCLIANSLSKSNMFVFVTYNWDFFTAMCNRYLPASFEDKAGFFNEKSNTEVRVIKSKFNAIGHLVPQQIPELNQVLSKAAMIQMLQEMSFGKALYVFHYVTLPKSPPSRQRWDHIQVDSSLAKVPSTMRIDAMDYHWTYEDCQNLTDEQRNLFDSIRKASNDVSWDNDSRHIITEKEINILNPEKDEKQGLKKNEKNVNDAAKDFILGNEKYGTAQIKVDIPSSTPWERRRNKSLYWLPHVLVMIVPDLVQSQINGMWQSVAGVIICAAGSLGFGEYIYPRIDSYNSDVDKLSQWVGLNNHKKRRRGNDFVWLSILHSVGNLVAQKCLSWQAMPWRVLGGAIHVVRAFLSCQALIYNENITNKDPFKRRNKDGVPYMLKDLANGPKFENNK